MMINLYGYEENIKIKYIKKSCSYAYIDYVIKIYM